MISYKSINFDKFLSYEKMSISGIIFNILISRLNPDIFHLKIWIINKLFNEFANDVLLIIFVPENLI